MASNTSIQRHIPNALSVSRILLTCVILAFFIIPHELYVVQILIIVAIITDKLDGSLARLWNVESDLGKRLESVADPFFTFIAGIYLFLFLDLPTEIFIACTVLLLFASLCRALIQLKYKKMFYKKSPLTRISVGFAYIILLLYLFQIPYRHEFLLVFFVFGLVAAANYFRMMIQFVIQEQKKK